MGLAERILAAIDLPPQDAGDIPEWGILAGEAFQRGMTGLERRKWEACFVRDESGALVNPAADPRSLAVGQTLVDQVGSRIFDDTQLEQLGCKSAAILDRLYDNAIRLSGIGLKKDESEAARKNSEATSGSDSVSG